MLKKLAAAAVHLLFFAGVVAIAGYWAVKIFTPAPTAAPPPLAPPPLRDPDVAAAARMFGKVEQAQVQVAANIQAVGAFAAGAQSSAVLVVDGKPARVFLIGQDVVPGTKLTAVDGEVVVLDASGTRQEVRLPPRPAVAVSGGAPAPTFVRDGNTLTAPSSTNPAAPARSAPAPSQPMQAAPPPAATAPQTQ